jgi:hypothetical protein
MRVKIAMVKEPEQHMAEVHARLRSVLGQFTEYVKLNHQVPDEILLSLQNVDDPQRLADTMSAFIQQTPQMKQQIIEAPSISDQLDELTSILAMELEILEIKNQLDTEVRDRIHKSQREFFLQEQMRVIKQELGDMDEFPDELGDLSSQVTEFVRELIHISEFLLNDPHLFLQEKLPLRFMNTIPYFRVELVFDLQDLQFHGQDGGEFIELIRDRRRFDNLLLHLRRLLDKRRHGIGQPLRIVHILKRQQDLVRDLMVQLHIFGKLPQNRTQPGMHFSHMLFRLLHHSNLNTHIGLKHNFVFDRWTSYSGWKYNG